MKKKNGKGEINEQKSDIKISTGTKDIVSTIYHIRNYNWQTETSGKTNNYTVLFDGKEMVIAVTYMGKENINTALGNKECYKLSMALKNKNILKTY